MRRVRLICFRVKHFFRVAVVSGYYQNIIAFFHLFIILPKFESTVSAANNGFFRFPGMTDDIQIGKVVPQ